MTTIRILLSPIRRLMVLVLVCGVAFPTVVTTAVCRPVRGAEVQTCCPCGMMNSKMMAAMPGGTHGACRAAAGSGQKPPTCTVVNTRQLSAPTASTSLRSCPAPQELVRQSVVVHHTLNLGLPQYYRFNSDCAGFSLAPLRSKCVLII